VLEEAAKVLDNEGLGVPGKAAIILLHREKASPNRRESKIKSSMRRALRQFVPEFVLRWFLADPAVAQP
jgi:hypothetical protein